MITWHELLLDYLLSRPLLARQKRPVSGWLSDAVVCGRTGVGCRASSNEYVELNKRRRLARSPMLRSFTSWIRASERIPARQARWNALPRLGGFHTRCWVLASFLLYLLFFSLLFPPYTLLPRFFLFLSILFLFPSFLPTSLFLMLL